MKSLYDWFTNKYDVFDDDTGLWKQVNCLYLSEPPFEKGRGIRIIIKHFDSEDGVMAYIQDIFEGTDYEPDASQEKMFEVITKTIDDIMENMP